MRGPDAILAPTASRSAMGEIAVAGGAPGRYLRVMLRATLIAILAASPATAMDRPLSGPEFREATEGWTLYFETEQGEYFGAEQYFENGETLWLPREGRCVPGIWRAAEGKICFLYYGEVDCWRAFGQGGELTGAEAADPGDERLALKVVRREKIPLLCPEGPGV